MKYNQIQIERSVEAGVPNICVRICGDVPHIVNAQLYSNGSIELNEISRLKKRMEMFDNYKTCGMYYGPHGQYDMSDETNETPHVKTYMSKPNPNLNWHTYQGTPKKWKRLVFCNFKEIDDLAPLYGFLNMYKIRLPKNEIGNVKEVSKGIYNNHLIKL